MIHVIAAIRGDRDPIYRAITLTCDFRATLATSPDPAILAWSAGADSEGT